MGHQTFKCCICGEETTKPKSYAVEGGRACRTHQEAQDARADFISKEIQAKIERVKKQKEEQDRFWGRQKKEHFSLNFRNPRSYCWSCDKDGIMESEFSLRLLVLMSKMEQRGLKPNLFFIDDVFKEAIKEEFKGVAVLKFFPAKRTEPESKFRNIIHKKHHHGLLQVSYMTEVMVICMDCSKEHKLDWNYDKPDIALEHAMMFSSLVQPDIDAIAGSQIAIEDMKSRCS